MSGKRTKAVASAIRSFLRRRNVNVRTIVLFGSRARGSHTADSDLDIAIVSPDFDGKDIFQKIEMIKGLNWHLVEKFLFPFDLVPISWKEWRQSTAPMIDFIREGKIVA